MSANAWWIKLGDTRVRIYSLEQLLCTCWWLNLRVWSPDRDEWQGDDRD